MGLQKLDQLHNSYLKLRNTLSTEVFPGLAPTQLTSETLADYVSNLMDESSVAVVEGRKRPRGGRRQAPGMKNEEGEAGGVKMGASRRDRWVGFEFREQGFLKFLKNPF